MNKLLSFISLMKKSGTLKSGEFSVMEAIKNKEARLVIIAGDASENTKKRFTDKAGYREISLIEFADKLSLGKAIGKDYAVSIAVCDKGFAEAFCCKYRRYLNGKDESI